MQGLTESNNPETPELDGAKMPAPAHDSMLQLKTPVELRYYRSADLKPTPGMFQAGIQKPYGEISETEARQLPAYYVGKFAAGVLIETEKVLNGKSQFLITYQYNGVRADSSKIVPSNRSEQPAE